MSVQRAGRDPGSHPLESHPDYDTDLSGFDVQWVDITGGNNGGAGNDGNVFANVPPVDGLRRDEFAELVAVDWQHLITIDGITDGGIIDSQLGWGINMTFDEEFYQNTAIQNDGGFTTNPGAAPAESRSGTDVNTGQLGFSRVQLEYLAGGTQRHLVHWEADDGTEYYRQPAHGITSGFFVTAEDEFNIKLGITERETVSDEYEARGGFRLLWNVYEEEDMVSQRGPPL